MTYFAGSDYISTQLFATWTLLNCKRKVGEEAAEKLSQNLSVSFNCAPAKHPWIGNWTPWGSSHHQIETLPKRLSPTKIMQFKVSKVMKQMYKKWLVPREPNLRSVMELKKDFNIRRKYTWRFSKKKTTQTRSPWCTKEVKFAFCIFSTGWINKSRKQVKGNNSMCMLLTISHLYREMWAFQPQGRVLLC